MSPADRYIVAIAELATSVEDEAKALAADLGTTAYDERRKLAAGLPAIVLATPAADAAQAQLARLEARGHRAQLCRAGDVVAATAMISLRRFQLDPDALVAGTDRLPWSEIAVLVRARHARHAESTEIVKQRKFDLGRTLVTGGLVTRKTEKREVVTRSEQIEQVLYVFRASGATPWLLRELGTHYSGLGASATPTASRNFALAVDALRARAPSARFDDRLLRRAALADVDLYAHLVATDG